MIRARVGRVKNSSIATVRWPNMIAESAEALLAGLTVKADKIRALANAGYDRTEISAILGIRYQHVRHVLVRSGMETIGLTNKPHDKVKERPIRRPFQAASWEVLLKAGFHFLGEWKSGGEGIIVLENKAPSKAGVYAFVMDDHIVYVGITQRGLDKRFYGYRRGALRQRTSARVKQSICDALATGKCIKILIATPDQLEWNGLPVDTAAGLEAALIRKFKPEWNKLNVRRDEILQ
jgi:hypothetical protein